ncbi:MAG: rhodanese-like domain-containing protein [Micromonosporaceae bacterium]
MMITDDAAQEAPAQQAPAQAAAYFAARLAFETDASDVHAALETGEPGFVLVDSRGAAAWAQAHIPGARHLPTAEMGQRALAELDPTVAVVTYCWGPGCNGGVRAALALARLGYQVKEMIGGIEYWIREGYPVRTPTGLVTREPDPLAAAVIDCAC